MQVIYSQEHPTKPAKSIFLAGPSPRNNEDHNWRPQALQFLEELSFSGNVYVPLPRSGESWPSEYDSQIEWELKYLEAADVIAFWIPRNKDTLPAFTTNVEFGMYVRAGKCVLGYPFNADKMKYLHHLAEKFNVPISYNLYDTMKSAVYESR